MSFVKFSQQNECSICLDEFCKKPIAIFDCLHKFHYECIIKWEEYNNEYITCPICNKGTEIISVVKVVANPKANPKSNPIKLDNLNQLDINKNINENSTQNIDNCNIDNIIFEDISYILEPTNNKKIDDLDIRQDNISEIRRNNHRVVQCNNADNDLCDRMCIIM